LRVAIDLLQTEGLENVFNRHQRAAEATRRAVLQWGLDLQCRNPAEYSSSLTAVRLPDGHSADRLRKDILKRYNISLGNGLGPLADKAFRIGHLGDFNDPTILATLSGVEMGLKISGVPHKIGGVDAAMNFLAGNDESIAEAAE
jgi:alanine-glyoxylate transaminase/serine-glyoxylate transaminase/serine-pyruvate transaminase